MSVTLRPDPIPYRTMVDPGLTRAIAAHQRSLASGATAFQAALAAIDAGFGIEAVYSDRKRRARRFMTIGVCFETYGRFGWLADIAVVRNLDLDGALIILGNLMKEAERRPAITIGARDISRNTIRALRLILRTLRRSGRADQFPLIVAALSMWPEVPALQAAE